MVLCVGVIDILYGFVHFEQGFLYYGIHHSFSFAHSMQSPPLFLLQIAANLWLYANV